MTREQTEQIFIQALSQFDCPEHLREPIQYCLDYFQVIDQFLLQIEQLDLQNSNAFYQLPLGQYVEGQRCLSKASAYWHAHKILSENLQAIDVDHQKRKE